MALKFTLEAPFRSISGVVSRKRYPDGRVKSVVVTKRGTMYERTYYPKGRSGRA
ncbi:MAG: hypothetical protein J5808_00155 [Paludibacteraceae bacterium]|nr:hypothetical protein [Paludibacteraceae bacterium]